jgi:8-hydroxy-5-deazaflavin:NADPH oxidoreductase
MESVPMRNSIAIIGGTGKEGKGLAFRWAKAGYLIYIGSRTKEKAQEVAKELTEILNGIGSLEGCSNLEAAAKADIVVLTVPYSVHRSTLESLKDQLIGKTLIDVTVPLQPPNVSKVQIPSAGSAAQEAREILGEHVEVATAFQNISYGNLMSNEEVSCDVLVTGSSTKARADTLQLVAAAGFTGWDAGPIENSIVVEGLTSILIGINKLYGSKSAGILITGVKALAKES